MRRREMLAGMAAAGLAASACAQAKPRARASRLSVLVLGGTSFLGPAIVEQLLQQRHRVTLFNRGKTNPMLFPQLELIRGDRETLGGLRNLEGTRSWDAVIDVWPFEPRLLQQTAQLMHGRAPYYYYVSSVAAYRSPGVFGTFDESMPLRLEDSGYNGGKAESERILQRLWPAASGVVRPAGIAGKRDDGLAVCYWLTKALRRGPFIAPGDGHDIIQQVDVHDVASWVVDSVEQRRLGAFNNSGTYEWVRWLDLVRKSLNGLGHPVWVGAEFLLNHHVQQHDNMPVWRWRDDPERAPAIHSSDRAAKLGWKLTPMMQTLREGWQWYQTIPISLRTFPSVQGGDVWGLSDARERELLSLWARIGRDPGARRRSSSA